jgi:hypothetical protein
MPTGQTCCAQEYRLSGGESEHTPLQKQRLQEVWQKSPMTYQGSLQRLMATCIMRHLTDATEDILGNYAYGGEHSNN